MRLFGGLVDRHGSYRVGTAGASLVLATIFVFFYADFPVPPMALFVVFMTAMAFRNVAHTTKGFLHLAPPTNTSEVAFAPFLTVKQDPWESANQHR